MIYGLTFNFCILYTPIPVIIVERGNIALNRFKKNTKKPVTLAGAAGQFVNFFSPPVAFANLLVCLLFRKVWLTKMNEAKTMNTNPEFLTTAQAAELLKITPRTVRNMCAAKKIGHLAIDANGTGKKKIYRIPWADFQKYLDSVHVQEESA